MTTEINLNQIYRCKSYELSDVVMNPSQHSLEAFILAFSEIKRRGIPINVEMQTSIGRFTAEQSKSIETMEQEVFQSKGLKNYNEYFEAMTAANTVKSEDQIHLDSLRKELRIKQQEAEKQQAKRDVWIGGLWFVGGLIVTLISLANETGGIIAYGAVIFGGIQFFRGLSKVM